MASENDYREALTQKLIEQLEAGTAPWVKPWDAREGSHGLPLNPTTGKTYRGANSLHLAMMGYGDPRWCTYKQAQEQGWQVRRGEKGTMIEYWKFRDKRDMLDDSGRPVAGPDGKSKQVEVQLERPRAFRAVVFNLSQMDNAPELATDARKYEWNPIERAEGILTASGATIYHDQDDKAFYIQSRDAIHMPPKGQFPIEAKYYSVALHELGHWTGHESRLDREVGRNPFGSAEYAKEELRAELASYFLSDKLGIPHVPGQHAAYIKGWIKVLGDDKNEIFRASRDAETITDYVLSLDREKQITHSGQGDNLAGHMSLAAKPETVEGSAKAPAHALAFDALPADEAVKRFPELESAYQVLAHAKQVADRMPSEKSRTEFLDASRKHISADLHQGKEVALAQESGRQR